MIYSISWMVKRDTQPTGRRAWYAIMFSFLAGGLVGGAVMGALLAFPAYELSRLGGRWTIDVALGAAALVASAYAGRAAGLWRLRTPQSKHQVPEAWRNIFAPRVASFIYAGGLGMIYPTRLGSSTAYPLAFLLVAMGRTPIAIVETMATIGLIRAASVLLVPALGFHITKASAVPTWMAKYASFVRYTEVGMLVCIAVIAATAIFPLIRGPK